MSARHPAPRPIARRSHTHSLFNPRRTALATAVAMLASPALQAGTLPTGGTVINGSATINSNAANTAMTINQTSQGAIINWNGFSIGTGDSVQFIQPNTSAVALNRVVGGVPSEILGSLSANGRVFLVNPSGVLFATGSSVNVGGLVASTLDISDADFQSGVASGSFRFEGNEEGVPQVVNQGTITAAQGGTVALIGDAHNGENGTITANGGTVALGGGQTVTLDYEGDGLTQLSISSDFLYSTANASNAGLLQADGGQVVMRAIGRTNAFEQVVNQSGLVRARSLENREGRIILSGGEEGGVDVHGQLDASAGAAGVAGGDITIEGNVIHVARAPFAAALPPVPTINVAGNDAANGTLTIDSRQSVIVTSAATNNVEYGDGNSYVLDGSINTALDSASRIDIISREGQINIDQDVALRRTVDGDAVSLNFDAARAFFGGVNDDGDPSPWSLVADRGAIDLNVNAQSSVLINEAQIITNGGSINLTSVDSNSEALDIVTSTLDTRVGQSDANASGDIILSGQGAVAGTRIAGSDLLASSGEVRIDGRVNNLATDDSPPGVAIGYDGASNTSRIHTTSGDITITGVGLTEGFGVSLEDSQVISESGRVDIGGHSTTIGVYLAGKDQQAQVIGGGGVVLRGTAELDGVGIATEADVAVQSDTSIALIADGGTSYALGPDSTIRSASTINLRPGGVDANGERYDAVDRDIVINGEGAYTIDSPLLALLDAPNLVIGSNAHAGSITVADDVELNRNLTLQNTTGGISLDAIVDLGDNVLALASTGNIVQTAGGITAHSLLAISTNGSVRLDSATNQIQPNTLAGSAAGDFVYVNANSVGIGSVSANGYDAGSNSPSALSAGGISAGGNVFVQNLLGNLILNGNVSGTQIDLVSAGIFDNAGGASVNPTAAARIWAANFTGENRGGLAGGNLYKCAYGSCGASSATSGVTYVYAYQPTLTIVIGNATREYGLANPGFTYSISGLVNGDTEASALSGGPTTAATIASNIGNYSIVSGFASNQGYALAVSPGVLAIIPATLTYVADSYSREYGLANPVFSGSVTGFRNGDTLASATTGTLAFTSPAGTGANVGSYAINGGGLSAGNYVFTQAAGNASALTITPALLTYVANAVSREYGLDNPLLGGTVTGLRNGDTLASATTGALNWTTSANSGSDVGNYAITGGGLSAGNYTFTQAASNASALTITPALLTYVANAVSREYGLDNPLLGGTITGFRNGDTLASATTGSLSWTTSATAASNVGSYAINGSGLSASNYVFASATSNATALTIVQAVLTYVANEASSFVGGPVPTLSGTVVGFRNGDTLGTATTGELSFTTQAGASSGPGAYAITGSGLDSVNYRLVQSNANFTSYTVAPVMVLPSVAEVINLPETDLYGNNLSVVTAICASSLGDAVSVGGADSLAQDWSLLRVKPNLSSCVDTQKKNSCSAGF
jgi:filamentous hemagglutinin family protein